MIGKIKIGDTVRVRWGKRTAIVKDFVKGNAAVLDRKLGPDPLDHIHAINDLVLVKPAKENKGK